jgi:putative transposase
MDQFTRRIVGFAVHRGIVVGPALCRLFNRAIHAQALPKYLSSDHDPLYQFHQWKANLRILDLKEIKTVPFSAGVIPAFGFLTSKRFANALISALPLQADAA